MERMDAWSKTLVAIRVITEFKKRKKKTLEAEKAKKERRKNLWRRLRLKLRVFNLFANKISSDDPALDRILKLKRKIGDVTIESEEDACRYQIKIEESFQKQLGFRLKTGDIIMTHFDTIITNNGKKQKMPRRKSKIFERTHSYEDMASRTKQKSRHHPRGSRLTGSKRILLDPDCCDAEHRRRSWHSEYWHNTSMPDLARLRGDLSRPSPIVIISVPDSAVTRGHGIPLTLLPSLPLAPVLDTSPHNKQYVQARPCIVSRNLKKMFRK